MSCDPLLMCCPQEVATEWHVLLMVRIMVLCATLAPIILILVMMYPAYLRYNIYSIKEMIRRNAIIEYYKLKIRLYCWLNDVTLVEFSTCGIRNILLFNVKIYNAKRTFNAANISYKVFKEKIKQQRFVRIKNKTVLLTHDEAKEILD